MSQLKRAVVVSAVRTGIGKEGGQFAAVTEEELCAATMKEAVRRSGVDPQEISDCIVGNLFGRNGNMGRVSYLTAGLPYTAGTMTVDRQCGSGSQAVEVAAMKVMCGMGDVFLVSGVEHMTRTPYQMAKPTKAYQWKAPEFLGSRQAPDGVNMPQTAENVGEKYGVTREECDRWAVLSQQRAARSVENGVFEEEKCSVTVTTKAGSAEVSADECLRPATTMEVLAKLPAIVKPNGLVTAGNTCPRCDGAASMVVMSEERAIQLGLEPLAYIRMTAVAGLEPDLMGYGPVPATEKLLKLTGLKAEDIDCFEINEAFAAQLVPCIRNLGLDPERVNPNGGAIAMGHPLGATGVILATKLLHEMKRKQYKRGIVTMCIGGGQGMAVLYERP